VSLHFAVGTTEVEARLANAEVSEVHGVEELVNDFVPVEALRHESFGVIVAEGDIRFLFIGVEGEEEGEHVALN